MFDFDEFVAPADFDRADVGAPEVRNPRSSELVKRHPEWISPELVLVKSGSKIFLLNRELTSRLRGHAFKARLAATASSESGTFLWPVKTDNESMMAAAEAAKSKWIRLLWENRTKSYKTEFPEDQPADPQWPFADFKEMADLAFGDRKIHDPDDPVIRKILGTRE
jgi:hypothetical protein